MKFKKCTVVLLVYCFILKSENKDPFSEIKITSKKAVCQKDKNNKFVFNFTYIDEVKINFADGSQANSGNLSIKINTKKQNSSTKTTYSKYNIEQITLYKNVYFKNKNRNIKTDKAKIYPSTKICKLYGNIKIEQIQRTQKDIPITTECDKAELNLITEEIKLTGNKITPVNTIIKLENYPPNLVNLKKSKSS